jgi:hypothetical protein
MKRRYGFVSNSSSSSFVIIKDKLTEDQLNQLLEYDDDEDNYDGWGIRIRGEFVSGSTMMDNGTIYDFIKKLNIPQEIINFTSNG